MKKWHYHVYSDEGLIKWYDGYQKQKAQKAQIKKELMSIAWHPSQWYDWCVSENEKWYDWCMSEDEKKETEKLWK